MNTPVLQPRFMRSRSFVWVALLVAVGWAGLRLVPPPTSPLDLRDPADVMRWTTDTQIEVVMLIALRILVLALVAYLLSTTLLAMLARRTQWRLFSMALRIITTATMRRSLNHLLGSGIALSVLAGAGAAVPALAQTTTSTVTMTMTTGDTAPAVAPDPAPITMHLVTEDAARPPTTTASTTTASTTTASTTTASTTTASATAPSANEVPSTSEAVPAPAPAPAPAPVPAPAPAPESVSPTPESPLPVPAPVSTVQAPAIREWVIQPGDHLWHVAEHTVRADTGDEPTTADVSWYLGRLIAHNHDRFRVRGNPDLVFPGQVFELPPAQ